ncbi:MAG TPA: hypothetical protein VHA06_21995 [Candidatus Angelobacter sp.]|jgi:hypothetical protein|nr:hypothetical protein [Candidatus Angelobacter sp.]
MLAARNLIAMDTQPARNMLSLWNATFILMVDVSKPPITPR